MVCGAGLRRGRRGWVGCGGECNFRCDSGRRGLDALAVWRISQKYPELRGHLCVASALRCLWAQPKPNQKSGIDRRPPRSQERHGDGRKPGTGGHVREGKKPPWMPWDPAAWLADEVLMRLSTGSRAIWFDLLNRMWLQRGQRGIVSGTVDQLARLGRCTESEMERFLSEAQQHDLCPVSRDTNGFLP